MGEEVSAKKYRVVFHPDEGNRSRVKMALDNVENLIPPRLRGKKFNH
jgi:intracellular sulfur oxidation DsrE/DsrF family protein